MIDGIEYVPRADILPVTDEQLHNAVKGLVAILYFEEQHKAIGQAFNVLKILAPEIAELAELSVADAYHRMNGND